MIFFILMLTAAVLLVFSLNRITFLYWMMLAFISAFRYQVGSDYKSYVSLYYDIKSGYQSYLHLEPFHIFLNKLSISFDFGPQFVILIYSLGTMFLFSIFYFRMSKEYTGLNSRLIFSLSTMIFVGNFYFLSLNSIRSCLAASLYVIGLHYYYRDKKNKMLIVMAIGGGIHYSLIPIAVLSIILLRFFLPVRNKLFFIYLSIILINPLSIVKFVFVKYQLMYYNYFLSDTYAVPANFIGQISAYGGVFLAVIYYFIFIRSVGHQRKKMISILQLSILLFVTFRVFSSELFIFARMSRYFSPVLYFFVSVGIVYAVQTKISRSVRAYMLFFVVLILTISNILIFIPRGFVDSSYSDYKINYCIFYEDVCDVSISILK